MISCLLKKALPFTLTFVIGATVGGLLKPHSADAMRWASWENARREFSFGEGRDHNRCRMHRRYLVAETKPLVILSQPDAWLPNAPELLDDGGGSARANVTFGADGRVGEVSPIGSWCAHGRRGQVKPVWDAVERAARQIQFEPETINGVPVSVTKEIEIHFIGD